MPPKKRSGNPATQSRISSAAEWKKKSAQMELTLPSGEVCLVKRPGLPQLIAANVMPDMLSGIAEKAVEAGRGGISVSPEDSMEMVGEVLSKKGGVQEMLESFARVTAFCVIQPKVVFHKAETEEGSGLWEDIPQEDRDPDTLYTDEVDLEDQMFIFNYVVGGSADLAEFRKGLNQSVDGMANVQNAKENAS